MLRHLRAAGERDGPAEGGERQQNRALGARLRRFTISPARGHARCLPQFGGPVAHARATGARRNRAATAARGQRMPTPSCSSGSVFASPAAPVSAPVPPIRMRAPPAPVPPVRMRAPAAARAVHSARFGVRDRQHSRHHVGRRGRQPEHRERLPARHLLGGRLLLFTHSNLHFLGPGRCPAGSRPPVFQPVRGNAQARFAFLNAA